jgi:hypothetical protein
MKARLLLAAMLLAASAGPVLAARFNENELRLAMIQMEAGKPEAGQTVDALIGCLRYWNPGDRRAPNEVEIARLKDDTFTVSAVLRSRAIFHFQVVREYGYLVALLQRVEYSLVTNAAYQQLTDAESKRVVLRGACEKP